MITRFTKWVAMLTFLTIPVFAANDKNYTYLALGDSISYGFNPVLLLSQPPGLSEASFVGYPEIVAEALHLKQSKKLMNTSCPGETSASFLRLPQDSGIEDNGCNNPHRGATGLPEGPPFKATNLMHTAYTGTQMDFAVSQLRNNKDINLVTLSIGGNDLLLIVQRCTSPTTYVLDQGCVAGYLPGVLADYAANLAAILSSIRANYTGTLLLVKYYSPDPGFDVAIQLLNGVMSQVATAFPGVKFADGFQAFSSFGPNACSAYLLIPLAPGNPPTICDVHPSLLGQGVLAAKVLAETGKKP